MSKMEREKTDASKKKASSYKIVREYQGEASFQEALEEVIMAAWEAWIDAVPEDYGK